MKKILMVLVLMMWGSVAWGATYYMQAGGTAANKGAATGPCGTEASTMSIATHNAQTFSALDEIVVCSNGGNYTVTRLIPPSSGTDNANRIIYRNSAGQTPVIAVSTAQQLDVNGKSWITVQGITFTGGTYANVYIQGTTNGIILQDNVFGIASSASGAVRNVVITAGAGWKILRNTFYQGTSNLGLYGIAGTGVEVSDNEFIGVTGQTYTSAVRFDSGVDGLTFANNTINGWSLNAASDKLIYFNTCSNVTSSGNTVGSQASANSGYGYYLNTVTTFSSADDIIQYQAYGIYMTATTGFSAQRTITRYNSAASGHGWTITGSVASLTDTISNNNNGHGYFTSGASTFTGDSITATSNGDSSGDGGLYIQDTVVASCSDCVFSDSYKDGVSVNGGTTTLLRCSAYGNGVRDTSDNNGNGFTTHGTGTINLKYSVAYDNVKSGVANIENSIGNIYNCTFANNYRSITCGACSHYGEIYINSAGTQTIKNSIGYGPGYALYSYTASGSIVTDYNNFGSSAAAKEFTYKDGTALSFSEWKVASSQDAHSINQDPIFISSSDLNLQPSSPAAKAGAFIPGVHDQPAPDNVDMGGRQFNSMCIPIGAYGIDCPTVRY